jgi:hypothetical protein
MVVCVKQIYDQNLCADQAGAHRRSRNGKKGRAMKSTRQLGMLACILCVGEALIPATSAATPENGAGTNPVVTISTGQLRGSLTARFRI